MSRSRAQLAVVASTVPVTIHTFHRELLRQLADAGYEILVVSSPGPELDLVADRVGVRTAALSMTRDVSPRLDAAALWTWLRILRRERPALVLTATPKAGLLGMLAARATGVPRRVHYLGGLRLEGEQGRRRTMLAGVERLTAACAHVVVTNSPSLTRAVLANRVAPAGKLRTIEPASSHGVDSERFSPRAADPDLRAQLGLLPDIPVLGFVGRVTADKGVETLLLALQLLRERGPVQLMVLGSQGERDSSAWVRRLQGQANVVLTGHVDDVRPYLALVDLHVLPSRREGFPNVVLEAAAMEVPTVTTRATGAVDSVCDDETGLLVDVDDPEQLTAAVAELLNDRERRRRMGVAARAWAVSDFQPRAVVASFVRHVLGH